MVHDNFPSGVIVTNGLGGGYQDLIIAQFHLFIGGVGSPITGSPLVGIGIEVEVRGRGVPHGLAGTQYDPRWRRRDEDDYEPWKPEEDEKQVVLRVRVGGKEIERTYFRKDADRVIKAINFANKTKDRFSVTVDKLKDTTQKAAVSFKGFRKKPDEEDGEE